MNYRHSEDTQVVGAYSADGGRSWIPVEMAMRYTAPLIVVAGLHRVVENGVPRYLFVRYGMAEPRTAPGQAVSAVGRLARAWLLIGRAG